VLLKEPPNMGANSDLTRRAREDIEAVRAALRFGIRLRRDTGAAGEAGAVTAGSMERVRAQNPGKGRRRARRVELAVAAAVSWDVGDRTMFAGGFLLRGTSCARLEVRVRGGRMYRASVPFGREACAS